MTETVWVQMSRGDANTPWGFRLQGGKEYGYPISVGRVASGSLADRAGLKENDHLSQIAGRSAENMGHTDAQNAIMSAGNNLTLNVTRGASRIWVPSINAPDFPSEMNSVPVKYSLEHNKETSSHVGSGHNVPAQPFGSSYKSTTNTSSTRTYKQTQQQGQNSPADAYLRQTGGLFGTDQKLIQSQNTQQEEPSYLKSETLKLIQQSEHTKGSSPTAPHLSPAALPGENGLVPGAPVCDHCSRSILGVFCKAGGKTLHADCFKCATCGNSLKNVGYFLINEKLYCDIHAKQQKESNQFRATPGIDPNVFNYQPNVMQRPSSVSPSARNVHQSSSTYKSTYSSTNTGGSAVPPPPPSSAPFSNNYSSFSPAAAAPGSKSGGGQRAGGTTSKRGKGILKHLHDGPRIPICEACRREIRGPFVLALSKTWCPDHFVCNIQACRQPLIDIGFIEENGEIHCERCYEKYFAPTCAKCQRKIIGDVLTALQRQYHPDCFTCTHCHQPFNSTSFFVENGQPFCENDWNSLFTTKCASCQFPIEAGDRWVEALGGAYHSNCFSCSTCQKTLEGQSFYAKGGRPYCKTHA